eukprot:TRINITY_DN112559_c0_g1_i1.p2 TRINITY_DN112559_c0_g1~~TRINITY_DN112559_c0_g1_i1.p2  ORF type:complete len:184 (+),score=29.03 TRINITY_DN112559_c0_g1_i1:58-609(+)
MKVYARLLLAGYVAATRNEDMACSVGETCDTQLDSDVAENMKFSLLQARKRQASAPDAGTSNVAGTQHKTDTGEVSSIAVDEANSNLTGTLSGFEAPEGIAQGNASDENRSGFLLPGVWLSGCAEPGHVCGTQGKASIQCCAQDNYCAAPPDGAGSWQGMWFCLPRESPEPFDNDNDYGTESQ